MVRVAFVDTVGGAEGDMILGAFLAAGLDLGALTSAIELLQLRGVRLGTERVERAGVRATKLNVRLPTPAGHRHTHRGRGDGPGLEEIHTRLTLSGLPGPVVKSSLQIFRCLAMATAAVESVAVDELRFDSSDLIDTYVDVVGTAHALHSLDISRLYSSPLPVGPGWVQTSRGVMALPHPVTMEILRMTAAAGRADNENGEQVTPTGAAILSTLADFERPNMRVTARGAGAGTAELDVPNIVRLEIGELENPAPN